MNSIDAAADYKFVRWCFLGLASTVLCAVQGMAATTVRGTLAQRTEWIAEGSPYHAVENVEVPAGGVLVIHPGVQVRFERVSLIVRGTLIARGTEANPIVFTSNQARPAPGDWLFLQFEPESSPARFQDDAYVDGSILEHAVVGFGQGLFLNQASPLITKSTIHNNRKELGGGIFALGGKPVITDCIIEHNSAERGGGGIRTADCAPRIVGNTIRYNSANNGGGICIDFSSATIERNTVSYNSAFRGGGISTGRPRIGEAFLSTRAHSQPLIQENLIAHNVASGFGGGVDVSGTPRIIKNRIFNNRLRVVETERRNHAAAVTDSTDRRKQVGAGISVEGAFGGPAAIKQNAVVGNRSARWGGGAFLDRCSGSIEDNYFADNSAAMFGGGISIFGRNNAQGFAAASLGNGFHLAGNLFRNNDGGAVEITGYGEQRISLSACRFEVAADQFAILNHSPHDVKTDGLSFPGADVPPIYDYFDDQTLGKVVLEPAPKPAAPEAAERVAEETSPTVSLRPGGLRAAQGFLQAEGTAPYIIAAWSAVDGGTVAGYRVHVWQLNGGSNGRIAAFANEARSPFDAGDATRLRISGLLPDTIYEVEVVGYDGQGNETGASNVVQVRVRRSK